MDSKETLRFDVTRVGVVADTHVPDRIPNLHPDLLSRLQEERVELILHAGDISEMRVLDQLGEIAPVFAVTGNRDANLRKFLPAGRHLIINGITVYMNHGIGSFAHYFKERMIGVTKGYLFERYKKFLDQNAAGARVIIFGDVHRVECRWINRTFYFNPGSASLGYRLNKPISFGVLDFADLDTPRGIIIPLKQNWT